MSAVLDRPDDEVEKTKPPVAGFSSEPLGYRKPRKPNPTTEELMRALGVAPATAGFSTEEPTAHEPPVAGSPAAEAPADQPDFAPTQPLYEDLRQQLATAWNQPAIDDKSFAAVKDFFVVAPGTDDSPLLVADDSSRDVMAVGTNAQGVQSVLGNSDITAAQALSRALIAATSEQFKTVGITEVHGTDKDKVLLMLAANYVGLKIQIQPLNIDPKILEEAKREWEVLMATDRTAPTAGAPTVEAPAPQAVPEAEQPTTPPATTLAEKIREAVPDVTEQEVSELVATLTPDPVAVETETPAQIIRELTDGAPDAVTSAAPAFADTVIETHALTAFPDDGIPVHTEPPALDEPITDEERAFLKEIQISKLKPEVKAILAGRNKNENINPEIYLELRERVKAGDKVFADADGFINKSGITKEFRERGIGTSRTPRLIKALEADGITYTTTQPAMADRTLINYQVPARPALRPDN